MTSSVKEYLSNETFDSLAGVKEAKELTVLASALADIADEDDRIVAASADLKYVTQMSVFQERHPARFFQFGISERTMLGAAAGMAAVGLLPYVATLGSFAAVLGYENIRTDLAYPRMPVRVIGTHSGIATGFFGTSHHATEDLSALRAVPDLMILSPPDGWSGAALLRATVDHQGPIYFRVGRGREGHVYDREPSDYTPDSAPRIVRQGDDILIIATGIMVRAALDAAESLAANGVSATVLDWHTIKPFNATGIVTDGRHYRAILTLEEHNVEGGLGSLVQEAVARSEIDVPVYKHGLYDEFAITGPPTHLYEYYGLNAEGVATVAQRLLQTTDGVRDDSFRRLWRTRDRERVMQKHQGD